MFVPTTSLRRTILLVLTALMCGAIGLAGAQPAHARTPAAQPSARVASASTHPGGLVYTRVNGVVGDSRHQIWVSNLTGSRRHQLIFEKYGVSFPRWGPFGGKVLYLVGRGADLFKQLWLIGADGRHKHLLHTLNFTRDIEDLAWAPGAGRIVLVMGTEESSDPHDIFIYEPRTNTLTPLHLDATYGLDANSVDWSHDGRRIVFSARLPNPGGPFNATDLYTVAPDGSDLQQVTNTPDAGEVNPRWSPDDDRLIFSRGAEDATCVDVSWIVNAAADGTDETRVPGACSSPLANWSPNGRRIVIEKDPSSSSGRARVWTTALDGTAREFIDTGFDASYRPPA